MNKAKIITALDQAYNKVVDAVENEKDVDTIQMIQPILNKIDDVQNQMRGLQPTFSDSESAQDGNDYLSLAIKTLRDLQRDINHVIWEFNEGHISPYDLVKEITKINNQ